MHGAFRSNILLVLFLGISACGNKNPQAEITNNPIADQPSSAKPTAIIKSLSTSQSVTPIITAEAMDKPTLAYGDLVNQTSITITPTLTITPPKICSPLGFHTFDQLNEIVSAPYDPPREGSDERHQGVDFAYYNHNGRESILGESISAVMDGKVVGLSEGKPPYGNMVLIETVIKFMPIPLVKELDLSANQSIYHLYAHMIGSPNHKIGDIVECGQMIGSVGNSGVPTANPHLHLETRIGKSGTILGYMAFYTTSSTAGERASYQLWRMSEDFKHFDSMRLFTGSNE
jgi:murein DD-endopeptidase MepM/ murein hydrolase activator NlpD